MKLRFRNAGIGNALWNVNVITLTSTEGHNGSVVKDPMQEPWER